jgi:hypothetical protein
MIDLFGVESQEREYTGHPGMGPRQRTKHENRYRLAESKERRCGTCARHFRSRGGARVYHKCELIGCSASEATDIRVSWVCDAWAALADRSPLTGEGT